MNNLLPGTVVWAARTMHADWSNKGPVVVHAGARGVVERMSRYRFHDNERAVVYIKWDNVLFDDQGETWPCYVDELTTTEPKHAVAIKRTERAWSAIAFEGGTVIVRYAPGLPPEVHVIADGNHYAYASHTISGNETALYIHSKDAPV